MPEMVVIGSNSRRFSPGPVIPILLASARMLLPLQAESPAIAPATWPQETGCDPQKSERTIAVEVEPIRLHNVDQMGLLVETIASVNRIERGPGPNELVFHRDEGIEIVDDSTLELVRRVTEKNRPGFSYSLDGSKSIWLDQKTVVVRDEKTGAITRINAGEEDLGRPALSPDNEFLVVPEIVYDKNGGEGAGSVYLRVFAIKSRKLIRKLTIVEGSYGGLTSVFSPDGKTLAVGNRNYRTNLFETANWTLRHELPRSRTHEIAFSPDGTLLAATYTDGMIALWSVNSGEILRTADSGCSQIQSLDWNPAGDLLATSGPKGTRIGRHAPNEQRPGKLQLWDPKKLRLVRDLAYVSQSGSVRFTRDGKHLVARFKRDNLLPETKATIWTVRRSLVEGQ